MTETAIGVQDLTKRFGSVVAIDGIDLEVPEAAVFGVLGPNGAGTTTTIRVLSTILLSRAGFDGDRLRTMSPRNAVRLTTVCCCWSFVRIIKGGTV
jgi:ABC-type multidrug transport system ATPase subunit